jgi:hypothetical protein
MQANINQETNTCHGKCTFLNVIHSTVVFIYTKKIYSTTVIGVVIEVMEKIGREVCAE